MWDLNNWFLAMMPDPSHPDLGGILIIQHQENIGPLTTVESELKGNLFLQKETNMRMKEHLQHNQDLRSQTNIPVPHKRDKLILILFLGKVACDLCHCQVLTNPTFTKITNTR